MKIECRECGARLGVIRGGQQGVLGGARAVERGPDGELAVAVAGAFGTGAVHRDAIAARARAAGARAEVIQLLYRVPAYRYQTLDQLLNALPGTGLSRS